MMNEVHETTEAVSDEKILDRLAKIKAHMESAQAIGSEKEAQVFAGMLNRLLLKHNFEMSDLEYQKEIEAEPVQMYPVGGMRTRQDGKWVLVDYPDIVIGQKRVRWVEDLGRIIANANSCRMVVGHSMQINYVGRKSNVAIAEYMWVTMYRTVEKLSWKEYKTARNKTKWEQIKNYPKEMQSQVEVDYSDLTGYRSAWIYGFINGIREILAAEMKEQANTSTALVRVDQDKAANQEFVDANTVKVKSLQAGYSSNSAGYNAGKSKASEVGLTARGMNKGAAAKQLG